MSKVTRPGDEAGEGAGGAGTVTNASGPDAAHEERDGTGAERQ